MAESEAIRPPPTVVGDDEKKLKHLEFIRVAVIYIAVCFSVVYEYAKENSGPLQSGVETVEGTVKTVVGPAFEKIHHIPFELLRFADHKVDEFLNDFKKHVPSWLMFTLSQARSLAIEIENDGVVDTTRKVIHSSVAKYEPVAKEMYEKYEPVVEQYAVLAWCSLNRLPLVPQVAQVAIPTAVYWSEKYNQMVSCSAEKGYTVATYLPLVPIERIAKVFSDEGDDGVATNNEAGMDQ